MTASVKYGKNVTDAVTENVTDSSEKLACSWRNLSEEITEDDCLSSDSLPSLSQPNDVEIINVCECRSKEFELASENIVPTTSERTSTSPSVTDIFKSNLPYTAVWSSILTALHESKDYDSLLLLCQELKRDMPRLKPRVEALYSVEMDKIDCVAQAEIPADGPRMLTAIHTCGDGNCMCHAASHGYFNSDKYHLELHARLVVEGVLNKHLYLNDNILERGASYIHAKADLSTIFTTYSDYYMPGQQPTDDSIECIYCLEIHSIAKEGTYLGLWQLAQLASVLGIPVHMIYPIRGESAIRNDFNRMFFPVSYNANGQDDDPLVIMWTGLQRGGVPNHFIPLLLSK